MGPIFKDFADCIRTHLSSDSCGGRHVHVGIVEEFYDWVEYLSDLDVSATGIAIKTEGESVNHSFRFIKRSDLHHYHVKGSVYDWQVYTVTSMLVHAREV